MVMLALLMFGVVLFLVRSIRRQPFAYIASGLDLIAYVHELEQSVAAGEAGSDKREGGMVVDRLRATLIDQLATAADANRRTNQSRAAERMRAGLLLLASIAMIFLIVGVLMGHEVTTGMVLGAGT